MRALKAADVAAILQCHPRTVLRMYREHQFPAPIDPRLGPKLWRWSPAVVESYVAGEWKRPAPRPDLELVDGVA